MGCVKSNQVTPLLGMRIIKPEPWDYHEEITREQLHAIRNEFWQHVPIYGGRPEIWRALRRAAEAPLPRAQEIVDSSGIIPHVPDMRVCFDGTGHRYELPLYVLSEPRNLLDG